MLEQAGPVAFGAFAVAVLLGAGLLARLISRWAAWGPAGPIALIAASPFAPHVTLLSSLSLDDLLPLLGAAMLLWQLPRPRLTTDRILVVVLLAVAIATLARTASALVNGGGFEGTVVMFAKAIGRPALLVAIAAYVAVAIPARVRGRFVAFLVACVGTFEAAFGVLAFVVPLPGGAGIETVNRLTSLYGVCPGRVSGTLGISPNFLGAVFVISVPFTLGLAMTRDGWRRWAWALAAALQVAGLVLTFTRSSIVLGIVLGAILLVYHRKIILLGVVIVASSALLLAALSFGCTTGSGAPGPPGGPTSLVTDRFADSNDRVALWYSASLMMLDHPIAGVGLGQAAATRKADPDRYLHTPFGTATSSAHNTILLAGAETGILGALAMAAINIGLALIALRCAWRGRLRREPLLIAAAFAVGGYLLQGMVNNLFEIGATSPLLALVVGAFAGEVADEMDVRPDGRRSTGESNAAGLHAGAPYTSPSPDQFESDGDP